MTSYLRLLLALAIVAYAGCSRHEPVRPALRVSAPLVIAAGRPTFSHVDGAFRCTHERYFARVHDSGFEVSPRASSSASAVAALRFGATRITRNAVARSGASTSRREADGDALTRAIAEGVTERITASADGLEVSWQFERDRAAGDWTVEIPVSGEAFVSADDTGLHFLDEHSNQGVRFGHGTWIDARGVRTPVLARYVADRIQLRVPAELAASSSYPAVLDPSVGPEFVVAPQTIVTPPPQLGVSANNVVVGFTAGTYLVTWTTPTGFLNQNLDYVHTVRVRASDGHVLDATPIDLVANGHLARVIRSDGSRFLVLMAPADRNGPVDSYLIRIDAQTGATDKFQLPNGATDVAYADGYYAAIAPSVYLVAANGSDADWHSAYVLGQAVGTGIVGTGDNFWVTWSQVVSGSNKDVFAARIRASDGQVLDDPPLPVSTTLDTEGAPVIASDGANVLIANDTTLAAAPATITTRGMRLRASDGALLDGASDQGGFVIGSRDAGMPLTLFHDGMNYVIDRYAFRVNPSDAAVTPPSSPLPAALASATPAPEGLFWVRPTTADGFSNVALTRVDPDTAELQDGPDGLLIAENNIRTDATFQPLSSAIVGFAAGTYLVTWSDPKSPFTTYAARVRASDGQVLDSTPIALPNVFQIKTIRSDGTRFLLLAQGLIARVSIATGQLIDTITLPAGNQTDVAYANGYYGIVTRSGTSVVLSRWSADTGKYQTYGDVTVTTTAAALAPAITGLAGNFWVAWVDTRNLTRDVYAARVTGNGGLLDATGLPVSLTSGDEGAPAICNDGTNVLVVNDLTPVPGGSYWWTHSMRLRGSDGAALDGSPYLGGVTLGGRGDPMPAPTLELNYDGTNYVVDHYKFRVRPSDGASLPTSDAFPLPFTNARIAPPAFTWVRPTTAHGTSTVALARVNPNDSSLMDGSDGIAVASAEVMTLPGPGPIGKTLSSVIRDGDDFAVLWTEGGGTIPVVGRAVHIRGNDGAIFEHSPRIIPGGYFRGGFDGLAVSGGNFVAANVTGAPNYHDAETLRFRFDQPETGETLDVTKLDVPTRAVACTATTCLLVFVQDSVDVFNYKRVMGVRIRPDDGSLLDPPEGVEIFGAGSVSGADYLYSYYNVRVVASDAGFLIVATIVVPSHLNDNATAIVPQTGSIATRLITEQGVQTPIGGVPGGGEVGDRWSPLLGIASDGTNFFVLANNLPNLAAGTWGFLLSESVGTRTIPVSTTTYSGGRVVFDGINYLTLIGSCIKRYEPINGIPLDGSASENGLCFGFPGEIASVGHGRSLIVHTDNTLHEIHARLLDESDGPITGGGGYVDAGAKELDAGHGGGPGNDAGMDAGVQHDAGSPAHDAGSPAHDAGSPALDAGARCGCQPVRRRKPRTDRRGTREPRRRRIATWPRRTSRERCGTG